MGMFIDIFNKKSTKLPFGSAECGKFLKETYKDSTNEVTFLNDDMYENILRYDEIVENISKLESEKKVIEHTLQNELGYCETGFCKGRKISWKSVIKSSIDTKKLKEEMPEIVSRYSKVSKSRVFKIK